MSCILAATKNSFLKSQYQELLSETNDCQHVVYKQLLRNRTASTIRTIHKCTLSICT